MKAFYNGYKRSGIARVHIERTTPVNHHRSAWGPSARDFPQAWCGVSATDSTASPKVPVDPAEPLGPGLRWCGPCLGRAVEQAGLLVEVAALLIAKEAANVQS